MHTSRTALFGLALLLLGAAVVNACRLEPSRLRGDVTLNDMALHFTGEGQVTLQSTKFGGSGFTIMTEMFLESDDGTIFSSGQGKNLVELRIENRKIVLQVGDNTAETFAVTQKNTWAHLVVSVDNKAPYDVKFYLDDMAKQETENGSFPAAVPLADRTGRLGAGTGAPFKGYLDNFVIINSVVDQDEVDWYSKQYIPFISSDNLVVYYPFNDLAATGDKVTSGLGGSNVNNFMTAEVLDSENKGPAVVVKASVGAPQVVDKFCDHKGVTFQSGKNDYENLPPFFNSPTGGHTITVQCENEKGTDADFTVQVRWIPEGGIDQITVKTSKEHFWRISAPGLAVEHRTWGGWNLLPRGADMIKGDSNWLTYKLTDEAATFQAGEYGYIRITENNGLLSYEYAVNTDACPMVGDWTDACEHREITQAEFDFSESPVPEMPLGAPSEAPGVGGRPPVLACPTPSPQYRPQTYRQNYYNTHGVWPDQPCVLGQWSAWSACTADCGGGRQTRTRPIRIQPGPQGAGCGTRQETRTCNTHHCPIHCKVSAWSAWSACTEPCDDGQGSKGTQTRGRTITVQPQYGGNECPELSATRNCNRHLCPVDCEVSAWGAFGPCTQDCGTGEMTRTRTVTTEQVGTGQRCPPLTDTDPCNTHPCPVNCEVGPWSAFEPCTTNCGGGSKTRTREITQQPCCLGTPCPSLVDIDRCNEDPCPITTETYNPCADIEREQADLFAKIKRSCTNSFTVGTEAYDKCMRDSCITGTPSTTKPDCLSERLKAATVDGYQIDAKCLTVTCPNECSGNGVCTDGACVCDAGFTGKDCLVESEYGCFTASAPGADVPVDPVLITAGAGSVVPMKSSAFAAEVPAILRKTQVVDSVVFSIAETVADNGNKDHHIMIMNNNGDGQKGTGEASYELTISGLENHPAANFISFAELGAGVEVPTAAVNGNWVFTFRWPASGRCGLAIKSLPADFAGDFTIAKKTGSVLQVLVASAYGVNKATSLLAVHKYTESTISITGKVCTNNCEAITDCGDCAAAAECGWCVESDRCMPGDASGPHYYGSCANWRYSFETETTRRLTQEYAAPVSPGYTDVYLSASPNPGTNLPLEIAVDIDAPEKIQWDLVVLAEWSTAHKRTWQNDLVSFLKALTGFPNIGVALNKHAAVDAGYEKIKVLSNPRDFHFIGVHVNNAAVNDDASNHNVVGALINMASKKTNPVGWRKGARKVIMITSEKPMTGYRPSDVDALRSALLGRDIIPAFVVDRAVKSDYQTLVDALGFGFVSDLTANSANFIEATIRSLRLAAGHAATFYEAADAGHLNTEAWAAHAGSFSMFGLTDNFQARFPIPVHSDNGEIQTTTLHMPAFGSAKIENVATDAPTAFAVPERSSGEEGQIQIIELKGMSWKNLLKVVPQITTPPTNGVLYQVKTVNGEAVAADTVDYSKGIIDDALGRVAYEPNRNGSGRNFDKFEFVMTDGCTVSPKVWVNVDVSNVNKPPVAEMVPPTEDEDTPNVIVLSGYDEDNQWEAVLTTGLHEMTEQGQMKVDEDIGVLYHYSDEILASREEAARLGTEVQVGDSITEDKDGLKKVVYWPAIHRNSHANFDKTPDLLVKPCFDYKVVETDGTDMFESNVARVPIDVRPVNDAPFIYKDTDPKYIYEWAEPESNVCWESCTFDEDLGEKYPWDAGFEYISLGGGDIEQEELAFRLTEIDCDYKGGALLQTELDPKNLQVGDILPVNEPGVLKPLIKFRPGPDRNNDDGGAFDGEYYCRIEYEVIDKSGAVSEKKHTVTININPVNDPPRLQGGDDTVTAIEKTPEKFTLKADDPESRGYKILIRGCKNTKGTFAACSDDKDCAEAGRQVIDCSTITEDSPVELTARKDSASEYDVVFVSDALNSLSEGLNYNHLLVSFVDKNDGVTGSEDIFHVNVNVILINEPPMLKVDGKTEASLSFPISAGSHWSPELIASDDDIAEGFMTFTVELAQNDGSVIEFTTTKHRNYFVSENDQLIKISAPMTIINEIISSFKFTPAEDFKPYEITMTVNDNGYTGQCRPEEGAQAQWSNDVCELTDVKVITVESVDQALIDGAIVAGAGVGVLGVAVLGAVAATRFFNKAGADPAYAPWEDFEGDGSAVSNPLYEAAGVEGSNALYQASSDYVAMDGNNNSYL